MKNKSCVMSILSTYFCQLRSRLSATLDLAPHPEVE